MRLRVRNAQNTVRIWPHVVKIDTTKTVMAVFIDPPLQPEQISDMSANATLTKKVADLETRLAAVEARLAALTTAAPAVESKVKKEKKVKNPDAPKRPASAYILFSNAKRAEVVAANPAAKLPEVAKILGGMWKALTPEQQGSYKPTA